MHDERAVWKRAQNQERSSFVGAEPDVDAVSRCYGVTQHGSGHGSAKRRTSGTSCSASSDSACDSAQDMVIKVRFIRETIRAATQSCSLDDPGNVSPDGDSAGLRYRSRYRFAGTDGCRRSGVGQVGSACLRNFSRRLASCRWRLQPPLAPAMFGLSGSAWVHGCSCCVREIMGRIAAPGCIRGLVRQRRG